MILAGKGGPFEIGEQLIDSLQAIYPVDVRAELAKMDVWLSSNPSRRPVRVLQFVKAWLKRAKLVNKVKGDRRANIAGLCGYTRDVDSASIRPARGELWESGDVHVGRLSAGGYRGRLANRAGRIVGGADQGGSESDA